MRGGATKSAASANSPPHFFGVLALPTLPLAASITA